MSKRVDSDIFVADDGRVRRSSYFAGYTTNLTLPGYDRMLVVL